MMHANSVVSGGLLLVQKSTGCNLHGCSQGLTGRRRTKGGVSRPACDLRPVSEVEAGANFRSAGQARSRLLCSLPDGDQDQVPGGPGCGAVTPSIHPEVPESQFVLGIRQTMGWRKVCGTTESGIWCQRVTPEVVCHSPILTTHKCNGGRRGSYDTAWVAPGHDCLCSYSYGHGVAVRPQNQ